MPDQMCCRAALSAFALLAFVAMPGCDFAEGSRIEHYHAGGLYFGGSPSPSPEGGAIMYSSPRSGSGDLYRVSIDGKATVRLTCDADYEGDAAYSIDGKYIVFIREDSPGGQVWIMKSDGSGRKQLCMGKGDADGPRFSPDGKRVVYARTVPELRSRVGTSAAREIFMVDVPNGRETRLTDNEFEDVFPAFSPDGKTIAFTRENHIWLIELDGTNERRVAPGAQPSFSPDGHNLALVAGRFGRQIDIMKVDGSGRRTLYSKNTTVSRPVFLLDGRSVVFLEFTEGRRAGDIVVVSLDKSRILRVSRTD